MPEHLTQQTTGTVVTNRGYSYAGEIRSDGLIIVVSTATSHVRIPFHSVDHIVKDMA